MTMITYEKEKSVLDKEVNIRNQSYVWFLGEQGGHDLLPLMSIWQNCETPQWILGEKIVDEALCAYFNIPVLTSEAEDEAGLILNNDEVPADLAGVFFIGVTKNDSAAVEALLEKTGTDKAFYFCSNKENGYYYKSKLKENGCIIVPEEKEYPSIYIKGIAEEERVLFAAQLFAMDMAPVFSLSYYLKKLFLNNEMENEGPFSYLNNLYIEKRTTYNTLVGRQIPFEKTMGQYANFLERPLSFEEQIETNLLKDNLDEVPALLETYNGTEDKDSNFIYNVLVYLGEFGSLNTVLPLMEKVISTIIKSLDAIMQKKLVMLLGELYLKEGSYEKAYETFLLFAENNENQKEKGVFYQKAIQSLLEGGLYEKTVTSLKAILSRKEAFLKDDKNILESYLLYSYNQKTDWVGAEGLCKSLELKEPRDLILKEIINYNQGNYHLDTLEALLDNEAIKENKQYVAMVTYLKILILEKEEESPETLKLFNRVLENISEETNPIYRRWGLLAYLNKGLITAREAKIFEGIGILKEGLLIYGDDVEIYTQRILKKMLRQKAALEMKVGEYETALMTIEEGLQSIDDASFYEGIEKGYFLLYKLEILGVLNRSYDETFENLLKLLKLKKGIAAYEIIEAKAYYLKESNDLKRGEKEKGLETSAHFWEQFKDNNNEAIESIVLDTFLFERDWLREKEELESLKHTLKKISQKFAGHNNQQFSFEGGKSLYELGMLLIETGEKKEGVSFYNTLLTTYENTQDKALRKMCLDASFQKGIYLYEIEALKEAKTILKSFKDAVMAIAIDWDKQKEECLFVLASIDEVQGYRAEAIDGFELYVSLFKDAPYAEKRLLDAYWHLSQLFVASEKEDGALKYIDLILENGSVVEEPYLMLNAYKEKAKYLAHRKDMDGSRGIYETVLDLFRESKDETIILMLSDVYRKLIAMAKSNMDFNRIKDDLEKVIAVLGKGSQKEAEEHFKILQVLSEEAYTHKVYDVEKWALEAIIKDFDNEADFQYKKGVAKSYYDLLILSTIDDDLETIEKSYKALEEKTKDVTNDMIKDYYYEGQLAFAVELFKRGHLVSSESYLKESLTHKVTFLSHYYLGRIYEEKGSKKKAIKGYAAALLLRNTIIRDDYRLLYYDGYLRKLKLLSAERSLFKKNLKKALKEMEALLEKPLLAETETMFNAKQASYLFEKGKLLVALGEKEQGHNTFKKAIRLFEKNQDLETEEIISMIYDVLGD